jgi:uncharacterized alkaline shock family protein YloU
MAEQTTSATSGGQAGTEQAAPAASGLARRPGGVASLKSDRGATTISNAVVTKVAGIAAREVPGVHGMGGGISKAVSGVTSRVGLSDEKSHGVGVEVGEREAAVDLTVVIDYGESIPEVSQRIRENVIERIEGITGLRVTEVNVAVNDLYFPGDEQPEQPPRVA